MNVPDSKRQPAAEPSGTLDLETLHAIERRVLWLAVRMVHEANHVRPHRDGLKVGGHQASSASVVSILTALYFSWLRAEDHVSIKPHASPAYHAIQYLLGRLDKSYLSRLRVYGGLQAYPSVTKDPDPVDFSTGSVGLGAVAPLFAALADRYVARHFAARIGSHPERRFLALVGDAELDEGNVWEAAVEDILAGLGNVTMVVDLNRQSLDRIVPGIHARSVKAVFAAAGWQVLEAKYGSRLRELFVRPGGVALQRRIDDMPNEEYQVLIRLPGGEARTRLIQGSEATDRDDLARVTADVPDEALPGVLGDLGGHDLAQILRLLDEADADRSRPAVLLAYTIKGWGLPFAGDALNHSALLTAEQVDALAMDLGAAADDQWAAFAPDTPAGRVCIERARALARRRPTQSMSVSVPEDLDVRVAARTSTQSALADALVAVSRQEDLARLIVTAAPDVAISTGLGGWINRVGVYAPDERPVFDTAQRLLTWEPRPAGQHVELGISEMNLFMWFSQFGRSQELFGQPLVPLGTVYDPFIARGLDALIYAVYGGARFILVGTPSGITLSSEGGAHQSIVTPSIGIDLPGMHAYEPAFADEVVWCLLHAIEGCLVDRVTGHATYLRLTTRTVDQNLSEVAERRLGRAERRRQVLAGGYRLLEAQEADQPLPSGSPVVHICVAGALVPEAVAAARALHLEEVAATVIVITSADRLAAELHDSRLAAGLSGSRDQLAHLSTLFPAAERRAPMVTVIDGAPSTLAFLGSAYGAPVVPLGVADFGQSGELQDLYPKMGIDQDSIFEAALLALDLGG